MNNVNWQTKISKSRNLKIYSEKNKIHTSQHSQAISNYSPNNTHHSGITLVALVVTKIIYCHFFT